MIRRLRLIRGVGRFDAVDTAADVVLDGLVLVHAENGQGKTTLAAILRSLATGDPTPIIERRRLTAMHPPRVVLDCTGGPPDAVFQDGAWNRTLADMAIFDDAFVDANIHTGLELESRHRQNLHEVVLGVQGVELSQQILELVARIEDHNRSLREKAAAVPEATRVGFPILDFCALDERPGVEARIEATEKALAAARDAGAVRDHPLFEPLAIPAFDVDALTSLLNKGLPDLDAQAAAEVQAQVARLGSGSETWLSGGTRRLQADPDGGCPFCNQDVATSSLVAHYRTYFSDAYEALKADITAALQEVQRQHAAAAPAGLERAVRIAGERRAFWSSYCAVPEISIDTAAVVKAWTAAREAVVAALQAKQAAPLDPQMLDEAARSALAGFEGACTLVARVSRDLIASNEAVQAAKTRIEGARIETLEGDLRRLRATRNRHDPEVAALCNAYLAEKDAKTDTEVLKNRAKAALDDYRLSVFPACEDAVNEFLRRFGAGFVVDSLSSTGSRAGPTCTYDVLINGEPVPIARRAPKEGQPSFRNTLSAGDRRTLALAFFFASLDRNPRLGRTVVVIDDPISSLDEQRSLATVQEIRRVAERAGQVIVLSHDRPFLRRVWSAAGGTNRCALQLVGDGEGSTIRTLAVEGAPSSA